MRRLCERPGCSEPASVAYGMRPEDLIFWLDQLLESTNSNDAGALCQRHADSMVVPRNWTLDDLRDPELHLFRPPAGERRSGRRGRRATTAEDGAEQLELGVEQRASDDTASANTAGSDDTSAAAAPDADGDHGAADDTRAADTAADHTTAGHGDEAGDTVEPWSPSFDSSDDLGGLLAARSPLLARAFRGDDRPAR